MVNLYDKRSWNAQHLVAIWAAAIGLLMAAAVPATAAAATTATANVAATDPKEQPLQEANCSVLVQGYGDGRLGVRHCSINCTSELPVNISTNGSVAVGTANNGVRILEQQDCQQQELRLGYTALLYFCGRYRLNLVEPIVRDVLLPFDSAGTYGSGILAFGGQVMASISGGQLISNNASAILLMGAAQVKVHNTTISNSYGYQGTGVLAFNGTLSISNSTFGSNTATYRGGGIYCMGNSSVSIGGCTFTDNKAEWGAGIDAEGFADVKVQDTVFSHQNVDNCGGALFAGVGSPTVLVKNATVDNNNGSYGGAVCVQDTAHLTMVNAVIEGNGALQGGGGLWLEGSSSASVTNAMFNNNTAGTVGGAVYMQDTAHLTMVNAVIGGNGALQGGGGLYLDGSSSASVTNSTIRNNTCASSGAGVVVWDSSMLAVSNSIITVNRAATDGAGIFIAGDSSAIVANGSVISGNSAAEDGGGVYMMETGKLTVTGQAVISNNTAGTDGGGLYLDGSASLQLSVDSSISGNHAVRWGGGVYLASARFNQTEVQSAAVQGNVAECGGQDVSVAFQNMTVPQQDGFVTNYSGRVQHQLPVQVNVSGAYGMPCGGLLVQAKLDDKQLLGIKAANENGIAELFVKVEAVPGPHKLTFSLFENPTLNPVVLALDMRSCIPGEVSPTPGTCERCPAGTYSLNPANSSCDECPPNAECTGGAAVHYCAAGEVAASHATCEACPAGKYSLNPLNSTCDECPANAECPGGTVIVARDGFWRSTVTSAQVHRCANPKACAKDRTALEVQQGRIAGNTSCTDVLSHSYTYSDEQCSDGYYGNLCGQCRDGYGTSKAFTCRSCFSHSVIIGLYVVAAVVMLAFMKLICHCNTGEGSESGATDTGKSRRTDLLKQLVLYMQYMLVLASMNIPWPVTLSIPLRVLAVAWAPASPETLTVECLMGESSVPAAIRKTLFYLCSPVALLLLLLLLEVALALGQTHKRARAHGSIKDRMLGSGMVATFLFIPSVARTTLSLFACVPLDKASSEPYCAAAVGRYWVLDMGQQCFEGYHAAWAYALGIPLLFVLAVALPLGISLFMWQNRHNLTMPCLRQHYGFLYRQYRPSCCYWEAVVVLQTLLLVAAGVFGVTLGPYYQAIVMNAVLALVFTLLLVVRPHLHQQTSIVALQSIACLLITGFATQSFLPYGVVRSDDTQFETYGVVMGVVVLIVNLAFLASVLWQLIKLVDWSQWWAGMHAAPQQLARALPDCCLQWKQSHQQQTVELWHDTLPTASWSIKGMKRSPPVEVLMHNK